MLGVSIGQVVKATGLTERQIRYCEEKGFINPARTVGGHRLYGEQDLVSLMKLAEQRRHGKTLSQAMSIVRAGKKNRKPDENRNDSLAVRLFFGLHSGEHRQ